VDLSGATPAKADFSIAPLARPVAYAATSSSQWVAGNYNGAILDGASLSSTARYFGYGQATSITAAGNSVAIATASGQIALYDLTGPTRTSTFSFPAGKLVFSADGTILAASPADGPFDVPDRNINFYSVLSFTLLDSIPSQCCADNTPYLADFTFSGSATTVGQLLQTDIPPSNPVNSYTHSFSQEISGPTGTPATNLGTNQAVPLLSPDGTLAAVANMEVGVGSSGSIQG
jgi:hypothetical protein